MIHIRQYRESDWPKIWPILRTTFAAGETYTFSPDSSEAEIHAAWVEAPSATFVAMDGQGKILGSYYIKPNQPGLGSHVCNCGYVVSGNAQGRGIASLMCKHSQAQALDMGFQSMQFNCVVSTNERAVQLWKKLGFDIVGTLPKAFRHTRLGYVDAFVMYKFLSPNN